MKDVVVVIVVVIKSLIEAEVINEVSLSTNVSLLVWIDVIPTVSKVIVPVTVKLPVTAKLPFTFNFADELVTEVVPIPILPLEWPYIQFIVLSELSVLDIINWLLPLVKPVPEL